MSIKTEDPSLIQSPSKIPNSSKTALTEASNKLKNYSPIQYFTIGSYVDALDENKSWRVAKIVEISNENAVTLSFDGWSSKWNETHKITSQRLAPFKKITSAYTGPGKNPIRNIDFNQIIIQIANAKNSIDQLLAVNFLGDCHFINQFIRGEIFILVDTILSFQYSPSNEQLKIIIDFLEYFINFSIKYLTILPNFLKDYIDGKSISPLLYLVHNKIAIVSCFPEIFTLLMEVFGAEQRCHKFFSQNEFQILPYSNPFVIKPKDKYSSTHNQIINFVNLFGSLGGFERILDLLKWELNERKSSNETENDTIYKFPLFLIKHLILINEPIIANMTNSFKEKYLTEFKIAFFKRINLINIKEIKDLEPNIVFSLLFKIQPLLDEICIKETYYLTEEAELNFSLKLLKSPYLQKKIKGMTHLKDIIDRLESSNYEYNKVEMRKKLKFYNSEKLKIYFSTNKVLEFILGENFHIEVFKRSLHVLQFLASTGGLTNEQLDSLWTAVESKHEGYTTSTNELLIDLLKKLPLESLEYLFGKLILIPQEKCDEGSIELMKEFSEIAMNCLNSSNSYYSKQKKSLQNPKNEFFALKYLWDLVQDNSKIDSQYMETALNSIKTLLKSSYFKTEKENYLNLCFENIKKGISVPQSLIISIYIISSYSSYAMFFSKDTNLSQILNKYCKEYNLTEILINNIDSYLKLVLQINENNKSKGINIENYSNYIFSGKYSHCEQIETRLNFLSIIDPHLDKKNQLNIEQIKKLWIILIKKSVTPIESNIFLNWLTKIKEGEGKKTYNFSNEQLKNIFINVIGDKILMDDYVNISIEMYNCIQLLFDIVNNNDEFIEISKSGIRKIIRFETLQGLEYFWLILIKSQNDNVKKLCNKFLTCIYLKLSSNIVIEIKLKIWNAFIVKCLDLIYYNNNSPPYVIKLIKSFLENFQGSKFYGDESPSNQEISVKVVLKKPEDTIIKIITLPSNSTFLYMRLNIIEEFGLKNTDFELIVGPSNIKLPQENEEDYSISVFDNMKENIINLNLTKTNKEIWSNKEKFKVQLANNQKFSDLLIELLSNSNENMVEDVWQILKMLPFNKNLKTQIEKFANIDNSEESWSKLLDSSCYRKLLYCLEIIDDILENEINFSSWMISFCKKKGINHLWNIFNSISIEKMYNSFNLKFFANLAELLVKFLKRNNDLFNDQQLSSLLDKSLVLLNEGLNYFVLNKKTSNLEESIYIPEEFIRNIFDLIIACLKINKKLISLIYNYKDLTNLLKLSLLEVENLSIRTDFSEGILSIIKEFTLDQKNKVQQKIKIQEINPKLFFLSKLLEDYKSNDNFQIYRNKCNHFFNVISFIFHNFDSEELKDFLTSYNMNEIIEHLIIQFKTLDKFEKTQNDNDYYLQGLLQMFECVIYINYQNKRIFDENPILLDVLLKSSLFENPSGLEHHGSILPPLCKSPGSRHSAFSLLSLLLMNAEESSFSNTIIKFLRDLLQNSHWRSNSLTDWNISSQYMEKSITGFVGLKNLGCTCYMNSLLQQFFMIPKFREAILEVESQNENLEENLLYQFQLILCALKNSHKQFYDPRGFCFANKDFEGKPINVLEQMDVDEFFNNFLDKLEGQIKNSKHEDIIKKTFAGVLSNELICKGCPHYSEREEPFLAIGLQVKNKKSIQDGLDSFIQGDMLEGENAYFCDKCDKNVAALKRTCIKKLPNNLILVLKRFEFDFDRMIKIKVNDYCEFPMKLNMQAYTQNFLKKKESNQQNAEELIENENDMVLENTTSSLDQEFSPEYYEYYLKGVVIHMGTSEVGHYYSLISDGNNKWLEFNDIIVRDFNIQDLSNEAFGGEEKSNNFNMSGGKTSKNRNAYLLFYERKLKFDENGKEIKESNLIESIPNIETSKNSTYFRLFSEIAEDNIRYYLTKNCFDYEFAQFWENILSYICLQKQTSQDLFELSKLGFLYFFSIILRSKDREKWIPNMVRLLKNILSQSNEISTWFLLHGSSEEIIKENLIDCPIKDIKYITSGIYLEAMYKADETESGKNSIYQLINNCIRLLCEIKEKKIMDIFYRIFYGFSKLSNSVKKYLISKKIIKFFFNYINDFNLNQNEIELEYLENIEKNELTSTLIKTKGQNIKSIDELVEKKKEKNYLENIQINYTNLIHMIANLICSFKFYEVKSPFQIDNIEIFEEDLEIISSQKFLRKIIQESTTKSSYKSCYKLFGHLSFKNSKLTSDIIKLLIDEINTSDDNIKVSIKIFESLMSIEDEYKISRIKSIIDKYLILIKDNLKFYKCTLIMIDYIFKMSARNQFVLKVFSQFFNDNRIVYKMIEDWLKSLKDLAYNLNNQSMKIFRKKNINVNLQMLQINNGKIAKKAQEKINKLIKILREEKEGLVIDYDSDEDYLEKPPKINDKFDIYIEPNGVVSVQVIDTFNDMFLVKGPNIQRWITYDYDKLAPLNKLHLYYEETVDFYGNK